MMDLLRSAYHNLGRKRFRTVLTILGIAIGVASVIIISSISECGSEALTSELDNLGLSGLSVSASANSGGLVLREDDLDSIRHSNFVKQAMPVMVQSTNITARNDQIHALLWGIDSSADQIISLHVVYGRSITAHDVKTHSNICLVDEAFSESIYRRRNIVGKEISILCGGIEENYKVVGVVKTGSGLLQNLIGDYIPTFVYVPYSTMQTALGRSSFDQIAVKISAGKNIDEAGKALVSDLNRNNGVFNGYIASNLAKQKDGLNHILNIITWILSAVGAISLLVASLGIMTVMLVSVNERTREIGIKKSIGAKRTVILCEFLTEAFLITLIGSLLGCAFGLGISWICTLCFHLTWHLRGDIIFMAVGFSIATGLVFGVYPAAKASGLKPVDALRME